MSNDNGQTAKIRTLNDEFRRSLAAHKGRVVMTQGVAELSELEQIAIMQKTRLFDDFTEVNDPYGEHDFGSFECNGHKVFFKMDYYDKNLEFGSEDPSDPEQTTRVLTVMLANEYLDRSAEHQLMLR